VKKFDKLTCDLEEYWDKYHTFNKLSLCDKALYCRLVRAAKEAQMKPSEFAQSLGFNYLSQRNETDLIKIHAAKVKAFVEQHGSLNNLCINISLYNSLRASAKKRNMSLREYIATLGFTYNVKMDGIEELIRDLTAHWDKHRTFRKFEIYDRSLYNRLVFAAKEAQMKPSEFAQSLGFNYLSQANETDLIKIHAAKLKALVEQNGSLDKLSALSPSLYETLTRSAKKRKMSLNEYTAMLGFAYNVRMNGIEELIRDLKAHWDKHRTFQKFQVHDRSLYYRLVLAAKKAKMQPSEFAQSLGYNYLSRKNEADLIEIHAEKVRAFFEQHGSLNNLYIDKLLYKNLLSSAEKRKMSLKEYLAKLGFSYTEGKKRTLILFNIRKSKKRTPYLSRIK